MIIKSETEIITQLKIHLEYDDGRIKSDILSVGDILDLTFRRHFKKHRMTGKITKIIPYEWNNTIYNSPTDVILEVDFSDNYQSLKLRIHTYDIIDFNKVNTDPNPDDIDSEMSV